MSTFATAPGDPLALLPDLEALRAAATLIRDRIPPTPQYRWPLLEQVTGGRCWTKHENHTPVGAFKVRGGMVHLSRLIQGGSAPAGIVSATRGNHGQSLAFAAVPLGIPVAIVAPVSNSREKNAAMRALGAEVIEAGEDFQESVEISIALAAERGWYRVPSFHLDLVAGVGTWALELLERVPSLTKLYVPIGLGSGICGALAAKRALSHGVEVIGVTSTGARAYAQSLVAGTPLSLPVSTRISDGMAVRTPDPVALSILLASGTRVVEVRDDEVENAMRTIFSATHNVAEGAGAAAFAALLRDDARHADDEVGWVLCGGNVDRTVFAEVLGHA